MKQKWVFQALTQNDKANADDINIVGLMAYSLYKAKKSQLATSLHDDGITQRVITNRLKLYHDNLLMSESDLDDLRKQAKDIFSEAVNKPYDKLAAELNKQLEIERQLLDNERTQFRKDRDLIIEGIRAEELNKIQAAAASYKKPSALRRFWNWLAGGFAGIFATILTAIVIFGLMVITSPEDDKAIVIEHSVKSLMKIVTTDPMPDTSISTTPNKATLTQ